MARERFRIIAKVQETCELGTFFRHGGDPDEELLREVGMELQRPDLGPEREEQDRILIRQTVPFNGPASPRYAIAHGQIRSGSPPLTTPREADLGTITLQDSASPPE